MKKIVVVALVFLMLLNVGTPSVTVFAMTETDIDKKLEEKELEGEPADDQNVGSDNDQIEEKIVEEEVEEKDNVEEDGLNDPGYDENNQDLEKQKKDTQQETGAEFEASQNDKLEDLPAPQLQEEDEPEVSVFKSRISVSSLNETNVSKLGRINNTDVKIYKTLGDESTALVAGTSYTDKVFYIKKQASHNGQNFYLISTVASASTGVIGWVKATDIWEQNHVAVSHDHKTYYLKGTGWSYNHAWGAGKDTVFRDLSRYANQEFKVNLTEKVGNAIWYRGTLNGKSMWIQAYNLSVHKRTDISKLGRINNKNIKIYKNIDDLSDTISAGNTYSDKIFYIKKQAEVNGQIYHLISTVASSTNGVIGWVRSQDMWSQNHVAVDHNSKSYYLKGTGWSYNHAWGAGKDVVYNNLGAHKGKLFKVHLTEKVGDAIWYRGTLDGKSMWIQAYNLTTPIEKNISKLGRLNGSGVKIYQTIGDESNATTAGNTYSDKIFYIKKQAEVNGQIYHLISTVASSTNGVIGWVRSQDMWSQNHVAVDHSSKSYYLKGTGWSYNHAWGAGKDVVYNNLGSHKGKLFKVNLTEKVGDAIWYRGTLDGKSMWIQAYNLTTPIEKNISKLGRLNGSGVKIYQTIGDESNATTAGNTYTDKVFYIKKQAEVNGQIYHLISTVASSTNGVIGWVRSQDMWSQNHVAVDHSSKSYYLKGTGWSYNHAWGAGKDVVYNNLGSHKGKLFKVNLTEKVGDAIWYRGTLDGKSMWIQAYNVNETNTRYTDYLQTFNQALSRQLLTSPPPQTDLYSGTRAYVNASYVNITQSATIKGNGVRLRTAPTFENNIAFTVNNGVKVTVLAEVIGDSYNSSTKWYRINYNGNTLYTHSSLVNTNSLIAETNASVNVRESASENSHIYGTLSKGSSVTIVSRGTSWHQISYGTWRNAKEADVRRELDPNNNDNFQHLLLSGTAGLSASDLNNVLTDKGVLVGKGNAFINAGKAHNVNEVYLVAHALLETGNGSSTLARGVEMGRDTNGSIVRVTDSNRSRLTGIKRVYNLFGIAAFDSDPVNGGARKAYEENWTSIESAILGGAKWISNNYINHSVYKQDTLYKMKWNPSNPGTHQYATDIGWVRKQVPRIKNLYSQLSNAAIYFDVPRYK